MTSPPRSSSRQRRAGLVFAGFVLAVLVVELFCRAISFDFSGRQAEFNRWPLYYRMPNVPVGEVYFRRPGPLVWHGKVLGPALKLAGGLDHVYDNEPPVTVSYDKDGFRNPVGLTDWDIVFAGDSFVELGYMPYQDLYTTRVGRLLHRRVKNLGCSYTGPLTYHYYLDEYGRSPSLRDAVMVFFGGNDFSDLAQEYDALHLFQKSGAREYRTIPIQTSFVKAAFGLFETVEEESPAPQYWSNAAFRLKGGKTIPISLDYVSCNWQDMGSWTKPQVNDALHRWSETATRMEAKPWLLYIPSKLRAFQGGLQWTRETSERYRMWTPTNPPSLVRDLCQLNGIEFIDATPALQAASRAGILTYNPVYDTHLNKKGSAIVAEVLAEAIGSQPPVY